VKKSIASAVVILSVMFLVAGLAVAYEPDEHDLGGRTVTFAGHNMHYHEMMPEGSPTWDRVKAAEEQHNFSLELRFIDGNSVLESVVAAGLAGDDTIDLVQLSLRDYVALATQGALVPLGDILGDYWENLPPAHQGRDGARELFTVGGEVYAVPIYFGSYQDIMLIAWNPVLFEDAGLPSLYDLINAGEWTWEKAREIGAQLTRDTDGDGAIDQYGFAGMFPSHSMSNTLLATLATNNVTLTKEVEGKTVVAIDDGGRASAILNIVRQIAFEDGSVHPDPWNFDNFKNGKVAMFFAPLWSLYHTKNENFPQGIAFLPKGPDADDYTVGIANTSLMAVPVTTNEDPKAVIDLWTAIHPPELIDGDVDFRLSLSEDEEGFYIMLQAVTGYSLLSPYVGILNEQNFFSHMWDAVTGAVSPAEAIAAMSPMIQARLDDLLGQ